MMKKALAAVALAAMTMSAQAGVVINEGFDNVYALTGWTGVNTSTGDANGWFQGSTYAAEFSGQSGGDNSFAAINYALAGSANGVLTTSEFDASNGVDISFYLRAAGAAGYSDALSYGFTTGSAGMTTISTVPVNDWTLYTVHLDAGVLGTTRFAFQYGGTVDTANYVGLDSLTVTTLDATGDVPEPATMALFAGGLLGLGAIRRRARK